MTVATTTAQKFDMRQALSAGTTPRYATIGMTARAIARVRESPQNARMTAKKKHHENAEQ